MDKEDRDEMEALVVGFLQQSLNENPGGFTLEHFERVFPDRCEEPHDWYKRYKKKNTLEALQCIKESVKISNRFGTTYISLILGSDVVDPHLVDLITNQKSSGKRKKGRPSSRAMSSFSLNKQYSNHSFKSNSYHPSRLNQSQNYRRDDSHQRRSSSSWSADPQSGGRWMASNDPRNRGSSAGMMAPPQVRSSQASRPPPQPRPVSSPSPIRPSVAASVQPPAPSQIIIPQKHKPLQTPSKEVSQDPSLMRKKAHLRQKILSMLNRKFPEIKLLYLSSLFQLEYEESIDPLAYGYKSLTHLLQDPFMSESIQINYNSSIITVSAKAKGQASGKENIASIDSNVRAVNNDNGIHSLADKSNTISSSRVKLNASDPFNFRSMSQSLEPQNFPTEPYQLNNHEIEDAIKYKTLRLIFKSPENTLRLDDWSSKFEQESRLKIRIRDYGFKTTLEFFKHLAIELPIKVQLNKHDEWVAVLDIAMFSEWLHGKLQSGHYRAYTSTEAYLELVAFPTDKYTFADNEELIDQEFKPAFILSVKRASSMWVQLRTPKRIEEHLCVEASMVGYEDYNAKDLFKVPMYFVKPGFPCAVFDSVQQRWCRALVLKAPDTIDRDYEITALLVDYAVVRNYPVSKLLFLMKTHLKSPVGPIYSRLQGIKDENVLGAQFKSAKVILQEYTSPPVTLACKFIASYPTNEPSHMPQKCFEVTLIDTRHGKDCNLTDDINSCDLDGADQSRSAMAQQAKSSVSNEG